MVKVLSSFLILATVSMMLGGRVEGQSQQNPPVYTVIHVENMDCEGCAKRIAGKLKEVSGVDKVQVDVDKRLLWVHPKSGQQPSARGLWEAVEKANDRPLWLQSPSGRFTQKPNS